MKAAFSSIYFLFIHFEWKIKQLPESYGKHFNPLVLLTALESVKIFLRKIIRKKVTFILTNIVSDKHSKTL